MFGQAEVEERFKFLGDVRIRIAGVEALQHAELEGAFAVLVPEGLQPLVRVKPRRRRRPLPVGVPCRRRATPSSYQYP